MTRLARRSDVGGTGLRQLDGRRLEALHALEGQLDLVGLGVLLGVDDDDLSGTELLVEELLGELVLDEALDRPPQRAGAEGGVVALVGDEDLGRRRELDADALAPSCFSVRAMRRSTICVTSSLLSSWNTIVSSMRFRNSGGSAA
jgi:hypothetical protein